MTALSIPMESVADSFTALGWQAFIIKNLLSYYQRPADSLRIIRHAAARCQPNANGHGHCFGIGKPAQRTSTAGKIFRLTLSALSPHPFRGTAVACHVVDNMHATSPHFPRPLADFGSAPPPKGCPRPGVLMAFELSRTRPSRSSRWRPSQLEDQPSRQRDRWDEPTPSTTVRLGCDPASDLLCSPDRHTFREFQGLREGPRLDAAPQGGLRDGHEGEHLRLPQKSDVRKYGSRA